MKIGFCGSQGTGKTTTAFALAHALKNMGKSVSFVSEVARTCPKHLPINENSTKEAQLWIMATQIEREQEMTSNIQITDRTLLDSLAYAIRVDKGFFCAIKPFVKKYMKTYDLIIYMKPQDVYLKKDGTRSLNTEFRDIIDAIMKKLLKEMQIQYITVESGDTCKIIQSMGDSKTWK